MAELITVIVPVYNVKDFLVRCLDSVKKQSFYNIEVLIVDDGSTDGSREICDRYVISDNRFKVLHKQNGGLASARNMGLDHAKGKYIFFLDSDDYIEKDLLHILYNEMEDYEHDLCSFGARRVDEKGKYLYDIYNEEMFLEMEFNNDQEKDDFLKQSFLHYKTGWEVCFRMFRRDIIEQNNIRFDEKVKYAEDIPFTFEYMLYVKKWSKIPYILYNYTLREGSITKEVDYEKMIRGLMIEDFNLIEKSLVKKDLHRYNKEEIGKFYEEMLAYFKPTFLKGVSEARLNEILPKREVEDNENISC